MKKPLLEFVNVCSWCDVFGGLVRNLGEQYKDKIDVKIYKAGKDFEYVKKYGMLTKSVLVINESKIIDKVNKTSIIQAFEELVGE